MEKAGEDLPAIVIIKVFFRFEIVYNDYYCVNSNLTYFFIMDIFSTEIRTQKDLSL